MFNHMQHQDGVCRSAIAIANMLTRKQLAEVTLIPLFTNDRAAYSLLEEGVKVRPAFGLWFTGFSRLVHRLPMSWLHRWFVGNDYDIEVAFQYGVSPRCIAAASRRSHASKYAWMHGYDEGLTLRRAYEAIGTVVCVSRCNAERLHKELPTIKVDYNYNPIDDASVRRFGAETADIERPSDGLLMVSVGRLSPEKGFSRLFEQLKRLKGDGYNFHFWMIGDGPLRQQLEQQAQQLGLHEQVAFLGRQSNPHRYTAQADLFVCSSFTEGYSTACTEAIMLDVPVLTTSVSGAKEIIDEADCGMLVDMDDESLYQGLKQILSNPTIIGEWKQRLLETRKRFSAEERIKRLIRLFGLEKA